MWIIQRKADGRFLKARAHQLEIWTLDKGAAKSYTSPGTALNAFITARCWQASDYTDCRDLMAFDRKAIGDDINERYQFVRSS